MNLEPIEEQTDENSDLPLEMDLPFVPQPIVAAAAINQAVS